MNVNPSIEILRIQDEKKKEENGNQAEVNKFSIKLWLLKKQTLQLHGDETLDLSMTAQEMRAMIVSRKKKDPRKEKRRDMRRRVELVESL